MAQLNTAANAMLSAGKVKGKAKFPREEDHANQQSKASQKQPLPESTKAGPVIADLDPRTITQWEHKDRPKVELENDPTFEAMIKDFEDGYINVQPILVRPKKGAKPSDVIQYEELFGTKRHISALRAEKPVRCIIEDIDDTEALRRMLKENANGSGLSVWAKALSWREIIDDGLATIEEIAELERIKVTTIEEYLGILATIPPELVEKVNVWKLGAEALIELRMSFKALNDTPNYQKLIQEIIDHKELINRKQFTKRHILNIRYKLEGETGKAKTTTPTVLSSGRHKLVTMKPSKTGYSATFHSNAAKSLSMEEFEKIVREALEKHGLKIS